MKILLGFVLGFIVAWCMFGNGSKVLLAYCDKEYSASVDGKQLTFHPCRVTSK